LQAQQKQETTFILVKSYLRVLLYSHKQSVAIMQLTSYPSVFMPYNLC